MTARKVLTLMLKEHGLTLQDDDRIVDTLSGLELGELVKCEYDKNGGMRYAIKMHTAIDYIDLDLDLGKIHES